jgi:hypothetical protein
MEYVTGIITLQAIFSLHWVSYCAWYQGTIREAVVDNVQKILKCRTFQLGYHLYKCPNWKWISAPDNFLMPEKGLKKRWRFNVINGLIQANDKRLC